MYSAARTKQGTGTAPQEVKDECFSKLVSAVIGPDEFTSHVSVGLVSVTPKAGTSSITAGLGVELATHTNKPILIAKVEELKMIKADDLVRMSRFLQRTPERKLVSFKYFHNDPKIMDHAFLGAQKGYNSQVLQAAIKALSLVFNHVLIDFPSLKEEPEYRLMSSLVEGVILVAEAGKTTKEQILEASQSIESAGGKVLGVVLNKQRYSIPAFIHKWL